MSKSVNVTKYDAGGSGDNVISDGYIKAVEKVWIDTYTLSTVTTTDTIDIAVLPVNKKITSIDITIETTASQTSGTVSVGFNTDASVDTIMGETSVSHNMTGSSIKLPGVNSGLGVVEDTGELSGEKGFQKVTAGTQTVVAIKLDDWTMTTGTIKSIVRYT